ADKQIAIPTTFRSFPRKRESRSPISTRRGLGLAFAGTSGRVTRSALPESHLLKHRAAKQPIRIAERLQHLEMVVPVADQKLDRFAGGFHRGRKVARLPLKFRAFVTAVADDQRRL